MAPARIAHNRRLGWMLSLAELGIVPPPDAPIDDLVDLVLTHLRDDFPDADTARRYVTDRSDRPLAEEIVTRNVTTKKSDPCEHGDH